MDSKKTSQQRKEEILKAKKRKEKALKNGKIIRKDETT